MISFNLDGQAKLVKGLKTGEVGYCQPGAICISTKDEHIVDVSQVVSREPTGGRKVRISRLANGRLVAWVPRGIYLIRDLSVDLGERVDGGEKYQPVMVVFESSHALRIR